MGARVTLIICLLHWSLQVVANHPSQVDGPLPSNRVVHVHRLDGLDLHEIGDHVLRVDQLMPERAQPRSKLLCCLRLVEKTCGLLACDRP